MTITVKQLQNLRVTRLLVKVNERVKEPDAIDWEGDSDEDEDD